MNARLADSSPVTSCCILDINALSTHACLFFPMACDSIQRAFLSYLFFNILPYIFYLHFSFLFQTLCFVPSPRLFLPMACDSRIFIFITYWMHIPYKHFYFLSSVYIFLQILCYTVYFSNKYFTFPPPFILLFLFSSRCFMCSFMPGTSNGLRFNELLYSYLLNVPLFSFIISCLFSLYTFPSILSQRFLFT